MHLTPQLLHLRSLDMARACASLSFWQLMKPLQSVVLLSLTINAKEQVEKANCPNQVDTAPFLIPGSLIQWLGRQYFCWWKRL